MECQEELFSILKRFFGDKEYLDYKNFLYNIENIGSEVYFYILAFLLEKKPFSKFNIEQYEKQSYSQTGNTMDLNTLNNGNEKAKNTTLKKPSLIATPSLISKFSPSITLSKSPVIKKLNKEISIEQFDLKMNISETNTQNLVSQKGKNIFDNLIKDYFTDPKEKNINFNNKNQVTNKTNIHLKPNILLSLENNFNSNNTNPNKASDDNNKCNKKNPSHLKEGKYLSPVKTKNENLTPSQGRFSKGKNILTQSNMQSKIRSNSNFKSEINNANNIVSNDDSNRKSFTQNSNDSTNINIRSKNKFLTANTPNNILINKLKSGTDIKAKSISNDLNSIGESEKERIALKPIEIKFSNPEDEENSDSEDENEILKIQGHLYKLTDINKLKKLWFKLVQKDLYCKLLL